MELVESRFLEEVMYEFNVVLEIVIGLGLLLEMESTPTQELFSSPRLLLIGERLLDSV